MVNHRLLMSATSFCMFANTSLHATSEHHDANTGLYAQRHDVRLTLIAILCPIHCAQIVDFWKIGLVEYMSVLQTPIRCTFVNRLFEIKNYTTKNKRRLFTTYDNMTHQLNWIASCNLFVSKLVVLLWRQTRQTRNGLTSVIPYHQPVSLDLKHVQVEDLWLCGWRFLNVTLMMD